MTYTPGHVRMMPGRMGANESRFQVPAFVRSGYSERLICCNG